MKMHMSYNSQKPVKKRKPQYRKGDTVRPAFDNYSFKIAAFRPILAYCFGKSTITG